MTNIEHEQGQQVTNVDSTPDTQSADYTGYIDAIKQLKANTVSKAEYESLVGERNALLNNLINAQPQSPAGDADASEESQVSIPELRTSLREKDISDIEFVTRALTLRDQILEQTGEDCFVGRANSNGYTPTESDYQAADRVARILRECVEESGGNNTKFIAELQSRMTDNYLASAQTAARRRNK